MSELEPKSDRRKLGLRVARAFFLTAASAVFWLMLWFLTSTFLTGFSNYEKIFLIMVGGLLFFTFATTLFEGTIYKYILIITRAFFLIAYLAYATNCGILTVSFKNLTFTVEFVPLLALMVVLNLLDVARGLLQAIEFAAQSPKD